MVLLVMMTMVLLVLMTMVLLVLLVKMDNGHELTIMLLDKMNSWKNVFNVQFDQSTSPQKTSMGSQITTAPSVSG